MIHRLALPLVGLWLLVACSQGSPSPAASGPVSTVTVHVGGFTASTTSAASAAAAVPTGVVTISVAVTASDIAQPIAASVSVTPGQSTVSLSMNVTAGTNRSFTASAADAAGTILFQGQATLDISAGTSATVSIALGPPALSRIASGRAKLANPNYQVSSADDDFQQALNIDVTNQTANAFHAFTRIARLYENPDDGVGTNNNSMAELLSRFGLIVSGGGGTVKHLFNEIVPIFPEDATGHLLLPSNAPTGQNLQAYLQTVLIPEIDGALANLARVTSTFSLTLSTAEISRDATSPIEIDFGDVKLYESALRALKAQSLVLLAYNANVDIDDMNEKDRLNLDANLLTDLFANDQTLLTPAAGASTLLAAAKEEVRAGINAYLAGSDFIRAETDDQRDDLFAFFDPDDPVSVQQADLLDEAKIRSRLVEIRTSLDGVSTIISIPPVEPGADPFRLDLTKFFGLVPNVRDFRPTFTSNNDIGSCFPDPTFGSIYPDGTTTNTDITDPVIDKTSLPIGNAASTAPLTIVFRDECSGINSGSIQISVFGPLSFGTSAFALSGSGAAVTASRSPATALPSGSYFMFMNVSDTKGNFDSEFHSFSVP